MSEYSSSVPSLAAAQATHMEIDRSHLERSTNRKAIGITSVVNSRPTCLPSGTHCLAPSRHIEPCRRLPLAIPNSFGLDMFLHSLETHPHIHIDFHHQHHCRKIVAHHFPDHKPHHPRIGRYIIPSPSFKLIF